MQLQIWTVFFLLLMIVPFDSNAFIVVRTKEGIKKYCGHPEYVMIASTGRSGSTMLTRQLEKFISERKVLKTHILPPDHSCFKGKILFIFSNPDKSAESALFQTLHQAHFGDQHFVHVQTADREWLKRIGGPYKQTEEDNLLSYDALGIHRHLKVWLQTRVVPTTLQDAQILAIKFENLWDPKTIRAIRKFLHLPKFDLPAQEERGHENLFEHEAHFHEMYNLGSKDNPRYAAYDEARMLWEQAPPFQFLKIKQK